MAIFNKNIEKFQREKEEFYQYEKEFPEKNFEFLEKEKILQLQKQLALKEKELNEHFEKYFQDCAHLSTEKDKLLRWQIAFGHINLDAGKEMADGDKQNWIIL